MSTPKAMQQATRVLIVLTLINYLNYIDRYILAAVLHSIQIDLQLTDFQGGALATAFMIPYFLTAPFYGYLGDQKPRNVILAFGATLWSGATFLCGFAQSFWSLMAARFALGTGESSFSSISPGFLTDFYPKEKHGRILAIFSAALPVGAALGYVLGGLLGASVGWRNAFFIVGLPGFIMAFFVWRIADTRNKKGVQSEKWSLKYTLALLKEKPYVWTVAGYCAYTFVLGGLAHWMPSYMQRVQGFDELKANLIFGGIAVVSGLLGTLIGGRWSDIWDRRSGHGYLKLSCLSMVFVFPFFALTIFATHFYFFIFGLFMTQFFFFLSTSPINVVLLTSVPEKYRSSAMAFAIFACHILGDAISSPLIGFISDRTESLVTGFMICFPFIILAAIFWMIPLIVRPHLRPWPENALRLPNFQSHRGYHLEGLPQNHMHSLAEAKKRGAEMAEFDIRLRSDGVPVLLHDKPQKGFDFTGLSTLRDVLTSPDVPMYLNIEIKCEGVQYRQIAIRVADEIKNAKAEKRVLVSSFNFLVLRKIARLLPEVPIAYLIDSNSKRWWRDEWLVSFSKAHILNVDLKFWRSKLGRSLHRLEVPMAIWTINERPLIASLLAEGAQSVISDLDPRG